MLTDISIFKKRNFFKFADEYSVKATQDYRPSTIRNYKSASKKFHDFIGSDYIDTKRINLDMLNKFEDYLTNTCHNAPNTIAETFKIFAKLLSGAYRFYKLNEAGNPFNEFKFTRKQTSREYLEPDELKKIVELTIKSGTIASMVRDIFVVECYTGLRISDILNLRWKNYSGNTLSLKMRKTKKPIIIPLCEIAQRTVEKHKGLFDKDEEFIFKLINAGPNSSPEELDRAIATGTVVVNTNLKRIAKKAGINKNISSHTGRHTFATLLINQGAGIYEVKELLGHSDVKVTQIYTHLINTKRVSTIALLNTI